MKRQPGKIRKIHKFKDHGAPRRNPQGRFQRETLGGASINSQNPGYAE